MRICYDFDCSTAYFLRVELQNGHLTRGHANMVIPSTKYGEPVNENGKSVLMS